MLDHRAPEVLRALVPPTLDLADDELHSFRITSSTLDDQLVLQKPVAVSPSAGFDTDSPRRLDDVPADGGGNDERAADYHQCKRRR